jgi:hypothetical protein
MKQLIILTALLLQGCAMPNTWSKPNGERVFTQPATDERSRMHGETVTAPSATPKTYMRSGNLLIDTTTGEVTHMLDMGGSLSMDTATGTLYMDVGGQMMNTETGELSLVIGQ